MTAKLQASRNPTRSIRRGCPMDSISAPLREKRQKEKNLIAIQKPNTLLFDASSSIDATIRSFTGTAAMARVRDFTSAVSIFVFQKSSVKQR